MFRNPCFGQSALAFHKTTFACLCLDGLLRCVIGQDPERVAASVFLVQERGFVEFGSHATAEKDSLMEDNTIANDPRTYNYERGDQTEPNPEQMSAPKTLTIRRPYQEERQASHQGG